MVTLRPEDAANQRIALSFLAGRNYDRARGMAELLIVDEQRAALVATIAEAMPAEHREYEERWAAWEKARRAKQRGKKAER